MLPSLVHSKTVSHEMLYGRHLTRNPVLHQQCISKLNQRIGFFTTTTSGFFWILLGSKPAKNGQYCFSGDQWNIMQDDMYTHIYAKLLKSFNVTHEVNQKVQQLKDRLYQQIYSQVMRELNATQEELHQALDTTREELLRKINTTQDKLQQEYLQLSKQVLATSCKEIAENDPTCSSGYSVADLGGVRGVQMHPPLAASNVFCVHNCTSPSNDYAAVACSNNIQA